MSQTFSQALEAHVYGEGWCETNDAVFVKCQDVLCRLRALSNKDTPEVDNSVLAEVRRVSLETSGGRGDGDFLYDLLTSSLFYKDAQINGSDLGTAMCSLRDFLGDFEIGIGEITLDLLQRLPALPPIKSAVQQAIYCPQYGLALPLASAILDCIFDYIGFNDPFDTYVKSAAKT
jgi:hypothetical protein